MAERTKTTSFKLLENKILRISIKRCVRNKTEKSEAHGGRKHFRK